jgi:hypothetical protein
VPPRDAQCVEYRSAVVADPERQAGREDVPDRHSLFLVLPLRFHPEWVIRIAPECRFRQDFGKRHDAARAVALLGLPDDRPVARLDVPALGRPGVLRQRRHRVPDAIDARIGRERPVPSWTGGQVA